jgi:hypothetical protein
MDSAPRPASAPRRKRTPRKLVQCLLCGEQFPKITAAHLETHHYTVQRYLRVFDASLRSPQVAQRSAPRVLAPGTPSASGSAQAASPRGTHKAERCDPPVGQRLEAGEIVAALEQAAGSTALAQRVAHELVSSPEFTYRMADEVAEAIFSGPFRDRLRTSLVTVLSARLEQHGKAVAALEKVRRELAQPWRLEQGGKDGGPTETGDLVAMGHLAVQDVRTAEELVLKAVKLAIDEAKGTEDKRAGHPLDGVRYTGKGEAIAVPAEIPAAQREIMRLLMDKIIQGSAQAKAAREAADLERAREVAARDAKAQAGGIPAKQDEGPSAGMQEDPPAASAF